MIGGIGKAGEIDETLVGGVKRGKHMRGSVGKTVVVGMTERDGQIIPRSFRTSAALHLCR